MDALTILKGARALLADPDHWIKDAHARTAGGMETSINSPTATCWCLDGALWKAYGLDPTLGNPEPAPIPISDAALALDRAATHLFPDRAQGGFGEYVNVNDDPVTTHEDVLKMLDEAIAEG